MNKNMKSSLTKIEKYWIMYDVGNSAFTLLVSTIIPIYFKNIASAAGITAANSTAYYSYAISFSTIVVAILGPILGTMADHKGYKKSLFTLFMMLGVLGCAGLGLPKSWMTFLVLFALAKIGFSCSLIFYDAMLTDVTTDERMDHVSSYGFAWGYLGSCIPFSISLAGILYCDKIGLSSTAATAAAFVLNAVWWFCITLPLLRKYEQKYYVEIHKNPISDTFQRLRGILPELVAKKNVLYFLAAFFFYIDGVYTIIDMATSYGKDVGISDNSLLFALLLTQLVAFPFSILFGRLAKRVAASKLIGICIMGYFVIAVFALQLDKAWEFWFLAVCVAVFQGAIQALSRSYFAQIIPKEKSSEYFGIYDIFGKGASFLGTMLMGISTQLFQNSKAGVALIAVMFLIGWILFYLSFTKSR